MKFKVLALRPRNFDNTWELHIKLLKLVIQNQNRMIDMINSLSVSKDKKVGM